MTHTSQRLEFRRYNMGRSSNTPLAVLLNKLSNSEATEAC